ncbi:hypothetical protein AGMMS50239_10880 [Bacteroidia bacterium]|nr:hypothetical protein AGMMS50239_10880 [Bacteroidia bacterium]
MIIMVMPLYAIQPVKVDLNMSGRSTTETNEPGYTSWIIQNGISDVLSLDDLTITLTSKGDGTLRSNWYKAGITTAQLVNDGVVVSDIPAESENVSVELKISGLPQGKHTILTYHNHVDNPATNTFAPMDIYFNGQLQKAALAPTVRVESNALSAKFYTDFTITGDEDAVFEFKIVTQSGASNKTVIINGFEIGTSNADEQATAPVPADRDEHADADNGAFTLQWTPASGAVSHDVYFGNSLQNLEAAGKTSPEYKGNQTEADFAVSGLYSMETYYWRIDEVDGNGTVTKGNVWYFRPRQLAFYGAEGYGRFARGGRGGIVIKVTNLNDSGPGSLRDAVENPAYEGIPRTILFDVSGRILLNSRLSVNKPYITIAGQTAPGKGICVSGHAFGIGGVNDVIFRHLRLRVGTDDTTDGMGQSGSNHCIIDHASISWSKDEATSSRDAKNITFQRCLISEPLNRAGHKNYGPGTAHGYAGSIGGDIGSYHHNLLAHSYGRNWSFAGGLDGNGYYKGKLDVFNNVIYNWGSRTTDGGVHEGNFVNNYYKAGAATTLFRMITAQLEGVGKGTQSYYVKGNILQRADGTISCDGTDDACGRTYSLSGGQIFDWQLWVDNPFFPSYATVHTAKEAYKHVLSDVGATQPVFDNHDIRIVQETLEGSWTFRGSYNAPNGTYGVIDHQNDVGGWEDYGNEVRPSDYDSDNDGLPDWWEIEVSKTNPHSPADDFSDTNADPDKDGFTHLDDFLDWMANPHHFIAAGDKFNLKNLAAGFTANPVFQINEAKNCSANLEDGYTAVIVPATDGTSKLGSFTFTVTDSEGSSLSRTVHLYFSGQTAVNPPDAQKFEVKYRYSGKEVLFLSAVSGTSTEPAQVSCFDPSGRILFQQPISLSAADTRINMSSLTPGIYFIRVTTAKGEQNFKIIKTL